MCALHEHMLIIVINSIALCSGKTGLLLVLRARYTSQLNELSCHPDLMA